VVATGSSPVTPPELEGIEVWHTNDATSSHEVPAGLVVVGGGVAGCELAQLYRRLGSEVTIVQRNSRLIPRLDAEAAEVLQAAFEEEGIEILRTWLETQFAGGRHTRRLDKIDREDA
jgi:dihydrolipoamide dehydrogenase